MNIGGKNYQIKMSINDIDIPAQNIVAFTLREWVFSQCTELECTFLDTGVFSEHFPLYEDSKVHIEISTNPSEPPFIVDMSVCDFIVDKSNSGSLMVAIKFTALPAIDNYFMTFRTKVFKHAPSSEVMKSIFGNLKAKADIRIDSNDVQDWYQMAVDDYTFARHVLKRSYNDIEDSPFLYMERDSKMVYTSLKKECGKESKVNLVENGFLSTPDNGVLEDIKKSKKGKILYFSPNIYRKNVSSSLNKAGAYGAFFSFYDNTNFTDYMMNFKYHPYTKYTNTNLNHVGKYARADTFNTQNSAMHKNYYLAMVQNEYVRQMFFSDYTQISVEADQDLKLFDRVTLTIPDSLSLHSAAPLIDKTNSGDYVIGGIAHSIVRDGSYNMTLVLFRNGINEPEKVGATIKMVSK